VRGGKCFGEVGDRLALPLAESRIHWDHQSIPAPTLFDSCPGVPGTLLAVLDVIQEGNIVAPWQLCNSLLQKFSFRFQGERPFLTVSMDVVLADFGLTTADEPE
jgi:hypothetical protein